MEVLTRGKLARLTHVNPETIRYYEREGILPHAPRTESGYRTYSVSAIERIQFVGRAKSLGMSLVQIRDLLKVQDMSGPACFNVKTLLTEKLVALQEKKRQLEALEQQITVALDQCNVALERSTQGQTACPVFCCLSNVPVPEEATPCDD